MGLGLTLTQHLLLLLLPWHGPRLGPAPASLTLTHCLYLSVRWLGGPGLPEAQPFPFSQVTRLGWGTFGTKPRKWGEGRGGGEPG